MNMNVPLPRTHHLTRNTAIEKTNVPTRETLWVVRCSIVHAAPTVAFAS